ncbi:NUDIX domain-containing protein [Spirillospora sp. NPDC048911]|uniref:NUDIX domain-containing protein n=1 Tax=Spirillospora sp. NPDC048911 TaxID=3364527 RepID=UPI003713E9A9
MYYGDLYAWADTLTPTFECDWCAEPSAALLLTARATEDHGEDDRAWLVLSLQVDPGKELMTDKVIKNKCCATSFVTAGCWVFRHTDHSYEEVGIQVPAGSIQPEETPEDAALREARGSPSSG